MNSKLCTLVCFFLASNLTFSFANITPETPPCYEPAPTNHHITNIFTTAIWVAWNAPTNQPFEYNIKVFETSTGILLQSFPIPGNLTSARAVGLQPNSTYTIRTTAVCPDGTLSDEFSESIGQTLIIDLVSNAFTIAPGSSTCSFNSANQFCEADPTPGKVVTFKIRQTSSPYASRYFGVYKSTVECDYTVVKKRPSENGSTIQFYCTDGQSQDCTSPELVIKNNGTEVARLAFNDQVSTNQLLFAVSVSSGYIIERFGPFTGLTDQGGDPGCGDEDFLPQKTKTRVVDRDDWEDITAPQNLLVSPNPFSENLDIKIPFANPSENTTITLYDLQGRRLKHLQMPGDQQSIQLSTLDLASGMYFLRAESGAVSETVKIIKTE